MGFNIIYYICIACPTVKRTLAMIEEYVSHGADAFQIDMPSKNPYSETEFVKSMMQSARDEELNYDVYMTAIREIRKKYPKLKIHIVVYDDVINSIGLEKFCYFCREIDALSLMIPGSTSENLLFLELNNFRVFRIVTHELTEVRIQLACAVGKNGIVSLRNRKPGETDIPGYETFERKYSYLRSRGITAPVYSVFGISTKVELANIRNSGAQGAIIGNVLMKLWDDKISFCKLIDEFQSLADNNLLS